VLIWIHTLYLFTDIAVHIEARCWWCSWLRNCTTSRKVAGLISRCVIGIYHRQNPLGRTMSLGSTESLTDMSKGKGKGKLYPRTCHESSEGEYRCNCDLSLTSALDGVDGQRHAPAALPPPPPRERPGTHCTGGWVDPMAGLDVY
jgi:hypothetical protein